MRGWLIIMKKKDFQLLDHIIMIDGRVLTIGLKNDVHFITQENAFKAYKAGEIVAKTIEIDGESVFEEI